jgi:peptide/nickel transport system substrate-binding protein
MADCTGVEARDAAPSSSRSPSRPEFFFASLLCGSASYIVPGTSMTAAIRSPIRQRRAGRHGSVEVQGLGARQPFRVVRNRRLLAHGLPYLDRLIIRSCATRAAPRARGGEIQIGVFNPVSPLDVKRLTAPQIRRDVARL